MEDKDLQQENQYLQSQVEHLQSKLDAIEKSNQQKSKFQLWLGNAGLGFLLGPGLKSSMRQLYQELPNKVKKDTVADVTTQVIWRFTRIGLFGLLIALIPIVLLWRQNQLFEKQNENIDEQTNLFEKQNKKIDAQIQLEESSRRGNLIVMMSNIMDKIDEELKEDWNNDDIRNLSPQLIGRISALSKSFLPYRFLQDSLLIKKPLSPERGQLLLALMSSNLDSITYQNINNVTTYEQAYLENVNLRNANLKGVNLKNAYLFGANLRNADLKKANLEGVNLVKTDLEGINLSGSKLKNIIWTAEEKNMTRLSISLEKPSSSAIKLKRANLNGTNLSGFNLKNVNLSEADLRNTNLNGINLEKANLKGANLTGADLIGADLIKANLECAELINVDLEGADLNEANLKNSCLKNSSLFGVNLTYSNLFETDLEGANLFGVDLEGAILKNIYFSQVNLNEVNINNALVSDKNWLLNLKAGEIEGIEHLLEKYSIDTIPYKDNLHHYNEDDLDTSIYYSIKLKS